MKCNSIWFLVFLLPVLAFSQVKLQVTSLFADNMVLQQKVKTTVWGKAQPNAKIEIVTGWGSTATTITLNDSTWRANIQTPEAGGPYKLVIKQGSNEITLSNILIGEVWLCSGQSNMEMPLEGWPPKDTIINSAMEISEADFPQIRLFGVKTIASPSPLSECYGKWDVCTPATAAKFSAVAYFFGRKLYSELKIPIGLIYAGWGGTPAEAWTSKEYLSGFGEFAESFKKLNECASSVERLKNWLTQFPVIDVCDYNRNDLWNFIKLNDSCYSKTEFDASCWPKMNLPVSWEKTNLGEFNGFVWFRKFIMLPQNWLGKELTIELGAIDDYDVTYINGIKVGATEALRKWKENRNYKISADLNNSPILTIAVRVHDSGGTGGGIYGGGFKMRLVEPDSGEEIPLSGEWSYLPVAELLEMKYFLLSPNANDLLSRPRVEYFYNQRTPTVLYNGMIAPVTNYSIKGVIWYQGESNTENPEQYKKLFPALIKNWRKSWGYEFPFYFTQIAPYKNYGKNMSQLLRDAQRKTLTIPNTGMAVTLDVGDSSTVHPANKKPVGERLAYQALAKQYNKAIVYSGPLLKSYEIVKNKIELTFEHTGSGLEVRETEKGNLFEIAGEDMVFKQAKIIIEKNKIIVWSDEISSPKAVQYAWANYTPAALFNKDGLPASSFRICK